MIFPGIVFSLCPEEKFVPGQGPSEKGKLTRHIIVTLGSLYCDLSYV